MFSVDETYSDGDGFMLTGWVLYRIVSNKCCSITTLPDILVHCIAQRLQFMTCYIITRNCFMRIFEGSGQDSFVIIMMKVIIKCINL